MITTRLFRRGTHRRSSATICASRGNRAQALPWEDAEHGAREVLRHGRAHLGIRYPEAIRRLRPRHRSIKRVLAEAGALSFRQHRCSFTSLQPLRNNMATRAACRATCCRASRGRWPVTEPTPALAWPGTARRAITWVLSTATKIFITNGVHADLMAPRLFAPPRPGARAFPILSSEKGRRAHGRRKLQKQNGWLCNDTQPSSCSKSAATSCPRTCWNGRTRGSTRSCALQATPVLARAVGEDAARIALTLDYVPLNTRHRHRCGDKTGDSPAHLAPGGHDASSFYAAWLDARRGANA